jgi:hypothetical protein
MHKFCVICEMNPGPPVTSNNDQAPLYMYRMWWKYTSELLVVKCKEVEVMIAKVSLAWRYQSGTRPGYSRDQ